MGGKQNDHLLIGPEVVAGNKVLAVTGRMQLYGKVPATTKSMLAKYANAGDKSIEVESTSGWAVGD